MTNLWFLVALTSLVLALGTLACGDDDDSDDDSSGDSDTGSDTGSAEDTDADTEFVCVDVNVINTNVPPCDVLDQAQCLCEGCVDDGVCWDGDANLDDCVCPDCATNGWCMEKCVTDGICNPYSEGCLCADCVNHPLC